MLEKATIIKNKIKLYSDKELENQLKVLESYLYNGFEKDIFIWIELNLIIEEIKFRKLI